VSSTYDSRHAGFWIKLAAGPVEPDSLIIINPRLTNRLAEIHPTVVQSKGHVNYSMKSTSNQFSTVSHTLADTVVDKSGGLTLLFLASSSSGTLNS